MRKGTESTSESALRSRGPRRMYWEQRIHYAAISDVGLRRQNNQDAVLARLAPDRESWLVRGHLFVVADGMGGHAVGELASKMAVDAVSHTFDKLREQHPVSALKTAIETANQQIHERGCLNRDFLRMGTTCTALVLGPYGAVIGHVGDSRAYRVRNNQIDQLTRDHSLVWELIDQRKIHPRDADRLLPRNVITRSLGPEPEVQVDMEGPSVVQPGDIFVLCSDGLSGLVSDAELGAIVTVLPPQEACRLLVNLANLRGGPDNISVIVVRAGEVPEHAQAAELPVFGSSGPGWGAFVMFCSLAVGALVGLGLIFLTNHDLVGYVILGLVAAIAGWWISRLRGSVPVETVYDPTSQSTIIWRPYRTASARLTPQFLHQLARLEAELHQAAVDERWPVDLALRDEIFRKSQTALQHKQYAQALALMAQSLDLLMVGVQWQRKQMQQREGRTVNGNPATPSSPSNSGAPSSTPKP
jgi:serine/threonine protein phosphatase PrpC